MAGDRGLIHIYTGNGKGKTTAAAGLAVRARGAGMRVLFTQFLKGRPSAEVDPLKSLGIAVERTDPVLKFVGTMNSQELEACKQSCGALFERVEQAIRAGSYDLVVLDEVFAAITTGMLTEEALTKLLDLRSSAVEVVLTGRAPGEAVCARADYISEIAPIKHPYEKGIAARRGIEY